MGCMNSAKEMGLAAPLWKVAAATAPLMGLAAAAVAPRGLATGSACGMLKKGFGNMALHVANRSEAPLGSAAPTCAACAAKEEGSWPRWACMQVGLRRCRRSGPEMSTKVTSSCASSDPSDNNQVPNY
jgi:hypothetical protein